MNRFFFPVTWLLLISVFSTSMALAQDRRPSNDKFESVYVVAKEIKGTQKDADDLKANKVESIELRYYLAEERFRGGTFFEVVHHKPGAADRVLGTLNYDDYQYTTGVLKKDVEELYGKWIYARNGASILATGTTIYLLYRGAALAAEIPSEKKKLAALRFLAGQAISLYKSKLGFALLILPSAYAAYEMYDYVNGMQNTGKWVPFWNGWTGKEMAERDWLKRVFDQAIENAKYRTPINEDDFDIDANYDRLHARLSGKEVEPAKTHEDKKKEAGPPVAVNTVPVKKDMKFALAAFDTFFKKYVEENVDDELKVKPKK